MVIFSRHLEFAKPGIFIKKELREAIELRRSYSLVWARKGGEEYFAH